MAHFEPFGNMQAELQQAYDTLLSRMESSGLQNGRTGAQAGSLPFTGGILTAAAS